MGLDSLELQVAVEEKFGILIPDEESVEIDTVGDFANSVYEKVNHSPNQKCLTQIVFHRIRQALVAQGKARDQVIPEATISDLLLGIDERAEWQTLEAQTGLQFPKLVTLDLNIFGLKIYEQTQPITKATLRKVIDWIISLNFEQFTDLENISTKYEVERIVCGIISDHMGIPINKIELHHSITRDLGIS